MARRWRGSSVRWSAGSWMIRSLRRTRAQAGILMFVPAGGNTFSCWQPGGRQQPAKVIRPPTRAGIVPSLTGTWPGRFWMRPSGVSRGGIGALPTRPMRAETWPREDVMLVDGGSSPHQQAPSGRLGQHHHELVAPVARQDVDRAPPRQDPADLVTERPPARGRGSLSSEAVQVEKMTTADRGLQR